MRMVDLIRKKREGGALTHNELEFFVRGVTDGSIPDYQTAAMLMAIVFRGMTATETAQLTLLMAHSGETVDLSTIDGFKVDKHSTGGVGDKTTLIVAPIVAACGVRVAKMSGRGLGHTGGTLDKLESIPGYCTSLSTERFFEVVRETGLSIIGQTGDLAVADKKLYALRDVTATVESLPLIAASVMSKKLAAGADGIVLDVKTGSGAFMKTVDDSIALAQAMVDIGERNGRRVLALITDMNHPLGVAIGNSIEVIECIETLCGHGAEDLTRVSLELAASMLFLAGEHNLDVCHQRVAEALSSGAAFLRLRAMVQAQGGDVSVLDDTSRFAKASHTAVVKAPRSGYLTAMDTERIGMASVILGAGRATKESNIDYAAGISLPVQLNQQIEVGDPLAILHTNDASLLGEAERLLLSALTIADAPGQKTKLIYARVDRDGIVRY